MSMSRRRSCGSKGNGRHVRDARSKNAPRGAHVRPRTLTGILRVSPRRSILNLKVRAARQRILLTASLRTPPCRIVLSDWLRIAFCPVGSHLFTRVRSVNGMQRSWESARWSRATRTPWSGGCLSFSPQCLLSTPTTPSLSPRQSGVAPAISRRRTRTHGMRTRDVSLRISSRRCQHY